MKRHGVAQRSRQDYTTVYPTNGMLLGLKGQRSKSGLGFGLKLGLTATRREFEFYECPLVYIVARHHFIRTTISRRQVTLL